MNPFDELEMISKGELIPGGKASGKPKPQDDHESKKTGREIEMEHVEGGPLPKKVKEAVADEIHDDHVEEHPGYYDDKIGLPAMERQLDKVGKSDSGSFRGGDPELAQQKQQEAKDEAADQDMGGDDAGDDAGDAAEPDEDAEIAQQDKDDTKSDKMASLTKAGGFPSIPMGSQEVSPVNTDEDYFDDRDPKRNVNNYYLQFRGRQAPFKEPCPLDRREHQHEVWSEALGYRIPLEGNPAMYLRRFNLAGDKEGYEQALKEVFKSDQDEQEPDQNPEQDSEQGESNEEEPPGPKMLLQHLNEFSKDQLIQISKKIWGDDYNYQDWMDDDYIRNDIAGSLMDLLEGDGDNPFEDGMDQQPEESESASSAD